MGAERIGYIYGIGIDTDIEIKRFLRIRLKDKKLSRFIFADLSALDFLARQRAIKSWRSWLSLLHALVFWLPQASYVVRLEFVVQPNTRNLVGGIRSEDKRQRLANSANNDQNIWDKGGSGGIWIPAESIIKKHG